VEHPTRGHWLSAGSDEQTDQRYVATPRIHRNVRDDALLAEQKIVWERTLDVIEALAELASAWCVVRSTNFVSQ
jgi:hypothetical protein